MKQQRSGQRRPLASLLIAHTFTLQERLLLVQTAARRSRTPTCGPAKRHPLRPAGGETVAARLWLLTPYKTLLCTALCNGRGRITEISGTGSGPQYLIHVSRSVSSVTISCQRLSALVQYLYS